MKEPWTPTSTNWIWKACCCCCAPKRPSSPDLERGRSPEERTHDTHLAQIAIDTALRLRGSSEYRRTDYAAVEEDEESRPRDLPPPSYDVAMKDGPDSRAPTTEAVRERERVELPTGREESRVTDEGPRILQPEGEEDAAHAAKAVDVFSDDEQVLTPVTSAPGTVVDEDEDDERMREVMHGEERG